LAIATTHFELPTVEGRRLLQTLDGVLASRGVTTVVLTTYCHTYAGYMTTFEEYQCQGYEAGYTLFGPYALAAMRSAYARLARALDVAPETRALGVRPEPMADEVVAGQRFVEPWPQTHVGY